LAAAVELADALGEGVGVAVAALLADGPADVLADADGDADAFPVAADVPSAADGWVAGSVEVCFVVVDGDPSDVELTLVLPQTALETDLPDASSKPVIPAVTSTNTAIAGNPYRSHTRRSRTTPSNRSFADLAGAVLAGAVLAGRFAVAGSVGH
jgi:hypothetical protein